MNMKLVLIRHGATKSNEYGKYVGRTDEPLSESGIEILNRNSKAGLYPRVSYVGLSPMKRCRQTAELIYGTVPSIQSEKFKEIDFGRYEGKNHAELLTEPSYQRWVNSGGILSFPEGESRISFIKRCKEGFEAFCRTLKEQVPAAESAALVVHGGTIMAILSTYSSKDFYSYQCQNAEGYLCELEAADVIKLSQIKKLKGNVK